jgi:hypothetical protein
VGTGIHGGFGATRGSREGGSEHISLPGNRAQIDHIFGNRPGHLPDTPANRQRLIELANDESTFIGIDKYGNSWHAKIEPDGSQLWVRHQGGIINEGGLNITPRSWNTDTGFNNNPFKGRKK